MFQDVSNVDVTDEYVAFDYFGKSTNQEKVVLSTLTILQVGLHQLDFYNRRWPLILTAGKTALIT
ncbi:hypothetical protein HO594_07090 [Streptococcus suis]|nr:hypothetical protein [Streptococcus suis]